MKQKNIIWFFVPLVFCVPFLAYLIYNFSVKQFGSLPVFGKETVINGKKQEHRIHDFSLITQDNKVSDPDWSDGKVSVVDFFFTHCPVVCGTMTKNLKKVQIAFDPSQLTITSISIDPKRDHPEQLKKYISKYGVETANWQFLTGDKKEIYKLARNSFQVVATDGDGGEDDFIHSEKFILLDKQKRIRGYYTGTDDQQVDILIHDINKLLHEN